MSMAIRKKCLAYQRQRMSVGRPKEKLGQNDPISESAAEHLANQHKVSPKTIKRDAQYAAAVDTHVGNCGYLQNKHRGSK